MLKQDKETQLGGFCRSGKCQLMPAVYAVLPKQLHHCSLHSMDTRVRTGDEGIHQLQDGVVRYHAVTYTIVLSLA